MDKRVLNYDHKLVLENGSVLEGLTITYHTAGELNEKRDNVIWVCHALTANSDVSSWWPGMVGKGCVLDTDNYFIVCVNILGSHYGTTGPLHTCPNTKSPYYHSFPLITIRDMVQVQEIVRQHEQISKIQLLIGGSMGGYQALEWSVMYPQVIQKMVLLATSAHESSWGIAIHTAQRMAIETDTTWLEKTDTAGSKGLAVARAIGMLTYRTYEAFESTQRDEDIHMTDGFKAASYMRYQGEKLVKRFNAFSYYILTKAMDTHNLARNRAESIEVVLQNISIPTLVISIHEDLLCPPQEQKYLYENLQSASLISIKSSFGHDGFLIETHQISKHIKDWLNNYSLHQPPIEKNTDEVVKIKN
ncbi:homoserine O-acetyltransferase MetX [Flavisolibacter tropicus]|uniref:homoserine O-acetyltransferase MetX n=1 Tax=Flavisolibacter tropicus TaxID=1492898 RepID=UPI00082A803C|nr:homoserine O-acetyltransferase [Flavisolibacter tropicus]